MTWDVSDSDIEEKFNELKEQETILNTQLSQIRKYQKNINSLKMIQSPISLNNSTIAYSLPNNYAGNEMDQSYRDEQKEALIININEFLGDE